MRGRAFNVYDTDISDEFAFLVVSCDAYSDIWPMFFDQLFKFWPTCCFQVYLLSNEKQYSDSRVKNISVGEDKSYSENLIIGLKSISEPNIILWLEDLIISQNVDEDRLHKMLAQFVLTNAGYLKLSSDMPWAYQESAISGAGLIPKGVRYRSAIGASVYRADVLKELLTEGGSAWDLDKSALCDEMPDNFYALTAETARNPPIAYRNVLIRGRWSIAEKHFLEQTHWCDILEGRHYESIWSWVYAKIFSLYLLKFKLMKKYWMR